MFKFVSNHAKYPAEFDLTEFVQGNHNMPGKRKHFNGRPQLIAELFPTLRESLCMAPKTTIDSVRNMLRRYFLLFDAPENFTQVQSLADLDDTHGALQMRFGIDGTVTSCFLLHANRARERMGLPPLYWPVSRRQGQVKSNPPEAAIREIYFELKHRVTEALFRWGESDSIAATGRNLIGSPLGEVVSRADVHATYRILVSQSLERLPTIEDFREMTGYQVSEAEFSEAVFGLFPAKSDSQAFFHLMLIRTGWNVATALDIDVRNIDQIIVPHPTAPDTHELLYSTKSRGNTTQTAISLKKTATSPANLVRALYERTMGLRSIINKQLLEQKNLGVASLSSVTLTELNRQAQSPWLGISKNNFTDIICLDYINFRNSTNTTQYFLESIIEKINSGKDEVNLVPNVTPRDFRDAYISFAYQASGYNWLITMLAAGHGSISALRSYLRRRKWIDHSRGAISKFQEIFWSEASTHKIVEPAFLKILMEDGEITNEQRKRWLDHKDRTRVGMGCKNPMNPPKHIAPTHPSGRICSIQRCTLCFHGIVFSDSLSGLARRLEELLHIKKNIPLVSWTISSFPLELEATSQTLSQNFKPEEIERERTFWRESIESGCHVIPELGAYRG